MIRTANMLFQQLLDLELSYRNVQSVFSLYTSSSWTGRLLVKMFKVLQNFTKLCDQVVQAL